MSKLNKKLITEVQNKLDEYGYTILKKRVGDDNQYLFFCPDMIVFVHPENELSVTFQATTKPEISADNILTLKEIPDIDITVMESFIFNDDNKLIIGDEAFELIKQTLEHSIIKKKQTEEFYENIMRDENLKFFSC